MPRNPEQEAVATAKRGVFLEALADYIDARIEYRSADPEWRSTRELTRTGDALEEALEALL